MVYETHSEEEFSKIAEDFTDKLSTKEDSALVVGLYGNLGAGKTTFTKVVAKKFGITDTVTSPTFVIEKNYHLRNQKFSNLIHIDAYRLESEEELLSLDWREMIFNPQNLILIEWPEKVISIMPEHIKIHIKQLENKNFRQIEIENL